MAMARFSKEAKSTKKGTKLALNIFTKYLNENKMNQPHDKDTLAEVLKMFYIEARKAFVGLRYISVKILCE